MVKDANPGADSASPGQLTAIDGKLLFSAGAPAHGWEPWLSDVATSSTSLIDDVRNGSDSAYPHRFTPLGRKVLFVADDEYGNSRLWAFDLDGRAVGLVGKALARRLRIQAN
jgi:ELWxxDGT repeat protein